MKFLLAGLLLFSAIYSGAQANWQPGQIVTTKGDTLHGSIDDRRWTTKPETISFQPATSSNKEAISLNNITSFTINGNDYYRVVDMTIDLTPTDLSRLVFTGQEAFVPGRYLLHRLYQGPVTSLYEINHQVKSVFVIEEKSGKLTELVFRNLLVGQDRMMQANNTFRQQLQGFAVRIHEKLIQRLNKLNYSSTDLMAVMPMINDVAPDKNKRKERGVLAIRPFVQAGLLADNLYANQGPFLGTVPEFDVQTGPSFGGGFEFYGKNGLQKFFMRIGFTADNFKAYDTVKLAAASRVYGTTVSKKRVSLLLNYQYGLQKVRIYGGLGASFLFANYKNHQFTQEFQRSWFAPQANIGVRFSRFFLQGEYHFPYQFSTYEDVRLRSYGIMAGVVF